MNFLRKEHLPRKSSDCAVEIHLVSYRYLREMDRRMNRWPSLYYEDIYILDKGYVNFFSEHKVC